MALLLDLFFLGHDGFAMLRQRRLPSASAEVEAPALTAPSVQTGRRFQPCHDAHADCLKIAV